MNYDQMNSENSNMQTENNFNNPSTGLSAGYGNDIINMTNSANSMPTNQEIDDAKQKVDNMVYESERQDDRDRRVDNLLNSLKSSNDQAPLVEEVTQQPTIKEQPEYVVVKKQQTKIGIQPGLSFIKQKAWELAPYIVAGAIAITAAAGMHSVITEPEYTDNTNFHPNSVEDVIEHKNEQIENGITTHPEHVIDDGYDDSIQKGGRGL